MTPAELARFFGDEAAARDLSPSPGDPDGELYRELHRLDAYKWQLERQNLELEERIGHYNKQADGLQSVLDQERREKDELTQQLEVARSAIGVTRSILVDPKVGAIQRSLGHGHER